MKRIFHQLIQNKQAIIIEPSFCSIRENTKAAKAMLKIIKDIELLYDPQLDQQSVRASKSYIRNYTQLVAAVWLVHL